MRQKATGENPALRQTQSDATKQNMKIEDQPGQRNAPLPGVRRLRRMDETLGKRIEESTEMAVEEVQQEVAVVEERIEESTERVVEEARQEVAVARRPWYQSKRWGSVLLGVLATFVVLFGLLAWWVASHPILAIDVMITHDFQESQAPWLRITMIAVSYIGNMPLLSIGLVALAAALFWMVDLRLEAITIVVISATSALLEWLVKLIVARPRPSASLVEVIQAVSGKSFPSGHVMSYIALEDNKRKALPRTKGDDQPCLGRHWRSVFPRYH